MTEEKKVKPAQVRAKSFGKVQDLLKGKKKVAIFTHSGPDPDALGSMMAMEWFLCKLDIEAELFCTGKISHPQNRAFENL